YPFNQATAERLMADAGWTRGAECWFQNPNGQRLQFGGRVVANAPGIVRRGEVLSELWKRSGFYSELFAIATQATNRPELKAMSPGVFVMPDPMTPTHFELFRAANIATEANRWSGINILAYNNPEFDRLYTEYVNTLEVEP